MCTIMAPSLLLLLALVEASLALKLPMANVAATNPGAAMTRRSVLVAAPAAGLLLGGALPVSADEAEAATAEVAEPTDEAPAKEPKKEEGGFKLPGQGMFKRDDGEALLGNPVKGFRAPWDNETDEEKAAKKAKEAEAREKIRYVPPPPPPGSTGIFGKEGLPRALDKAFGIAKDK